MSTQIDNSRPLPLYGAEKPDLKSDAAPQDRGRPFGIVSEYKPAGDQPTAIAELIGGISHGDMDQVLLGVTGSGKTFTMAHVIQQVKRPALVLAPLPPAAATASRGALASCCMSMGLTAVCRR